MGDERVTGVIADMRHEPARAPASDWLLDGPSGPDERPGRFSDPKIRFDLVITDRRLLIVPVGGGAGREREAAHALEGGVERAAGTPGCRAVGPADVAEVVVDRLLIGGGEDLGDAATDIVLRSPLGAETRFRGLDDRRSADEVVALLRMTFGERVRRAKVVRHGLFRRATRE